jgi:hypothetical protein
MRSLGIEMVRQGLTTFGSPAGDEIGLLAYKANGIRQRVLDLLAFNGKGINIVRAGVREELR